MNIYDYRERYLKWWKNKRCRLQFSRGPFKRVADVKIYGPPSFVYGTGELIYEDGAHDLLACVSAYRPRKSDVEVHPDDISEKEKP